MFHKNQKFIASFRSLVDVQRLQQKIETKNELHFEFNYRSFDRRNLSEWILWGVSNERKFDASSLLAVKFST